jgi:sarcosine oxidase subunit alpha
VHNGFGLKTFKESLTGPEYAARYADKVKERGITVLVDTAVLSLTSDKEITAINQDKGVFTIKAKAVILAMGCRERSRGALGISGTRPSGIYSAGTAQKYVNEKGLLPGKDVVILGSGDIGLIMARRMTLEGAKVHAVCEIMPYSSGLKRNIKQCLEDFEIPLYLSHTITRIDGDDRVTGVEISKVDQNRVPVKGSEKYFACDTVLFSVGLIPENELTKGAGIETSAKTNGAIVDQNRQTSIEGVFACGNVLHVHDLVDYVSQEANIAGKAAAGYILGGAKKGCYVDCFAGKGISYVLPQKIDKNFDGEIILYFRSNNEYKDAFVTVNLGDKEIVRVKKRIVTPGEMQTVKVKSTAFTGEDDKITVGIEV